MSATQDLPVQLRLARDEDEGMLEVALDGENQGQGRVRQPDVRADEGRKRSRGRTHALEGAREDGRVATRLLDLGQGSVVVEEGRNLPLRARQGDPELEAVKASDVFDRRLFRVGDAASRGHEVEGARPRHGALAEAVVVEHLALEEPGDGLQADVRMRRHVHRLAGREALGPVGVQEAPGAHEAATAAGEQAPDGQPAEARAQAGQGLEGRRGGGLGCADLRLGSREEIAHALRSSGTWPSRYFGSSLAENCRPV